MKTLHKALLAILAMNSISGLAHGAELSTAFNRNNSHNGNMFDVVTLGGALTVTGFNLNLDAGVNNIAVYEKSGSWVGSESNAAAWTLVSSGTVNGMGINQATYFDVQDFVLNGSATSALYITSTDTNRSLQYTNGTAIGAIAAANADLKILQGSGNAYAFGAVFSPRVWNGTIIYQPVPEPASYGMLLAGIGVLGMLARRRKQG